MLYRVRAEPYWVLGGFLWRGVLGSKRRGFGGCHFWTKNCLKNVIFGAPKTRFLKRKSMEKNVLKKERGVLKMTTISSEIVIFDFLHFLKIIIIMYFCLKICLKFVLKIRPQFWVENVSKMPPFWDPFSEVFAQKICHFCVFMFMWVPELQKVPRRTPNWNILVPKLDPNAPNLGSKVPKLRPKGPNLGPTSL